MKSGDRVRVASRSKVPGHQPGDRGTVLLGPILGDGSKPYYIVAMDKGATPTTTTFSIDEIEPDCRAVATPYRRILCATSRRL